MTHALKTIPEFYEGLESGEKTFEIRISDRDFKLGDKLLLQEYNPETKKYTGKEQERIISYLLTDKQIEGIKQGYCILGFKTPPIIQSVITNNPIAGSYPINIGKGLTDTNNTVYGTIDNKNHALDNIKPLNITQ